MVTYTPGGEFLVNTTVTGVQNNASIAALSNGGYVVTWQDASVDSGDIRGRLYAADGTAIGSADFTINLATRANVQSVPTVAALSGGGFVVTWQDNSADGGDIRGRIFASDATPITSGDFTFNNTTRTGVQSVPSVAGLVDGGFVVTWQGAPPNNDIWGRVFTSTGVAAGADDFVVNSTVAGVQVVPAVTALSDGGFVVTWQDNNTTSGDIRGRRFTANGSAVGSGDFAVNTTTASAQSVPSVAALTNGGFVVAWQSGASNDDIYGQVFNASGAASGVEFLVNDTGTGTPTTGIQSAPSVAALADGGFLVTWQDQAANADIRGRVYSAASGTSGGSEFTLNATTSASQQAPSVTGLSDGSFIAVWQDNSGTNNFDIRGRRFAPETTPPSISSVSIPDGPLRIGSVVTATITTVSDTDTYTLVSGTIGGFALSNLTKVNNTTYEVDFTVTEGGTDVAAGQSVPVADLVLRDSSNNSNTAFASSIVQGNDAIDANRPALASATVNGTSLVLNYNEVLDAPNAPASSSFVVNAGGGANTVTSVAISGQAVTLTLGTAVTSGQAVSVTYTDPTASDDGTAIQDIAGNDAVTLTGQAVTNNTPAPPTPGGGGAGSAPVSTTPTPGSDNLSGTPGGDSVAALAGNDTIGGGDGDDLLWGNQDNDIIDGGAGNNTIYGGMGSDSISAGAGNDLIFGNEGADTIIAGDGNNTVVGGQDSTDGADYITSGAGNDVIFGNGGNDSISAGAGNDSVIGGFGDDILYGNQGNDIVLGNEGNDLIFGGFGDDTLVGGLAADTLYGNEGNDVLYGNEGADRLVFGTNSGNDLVNGFSSNEGDRLDLQGQTYVLTQDTQGNAVLTLSGGGVVTLSGVASNQVNAGFFA